MKDFVSGSGSQTLPETCSQCCEAGANGAETEFVKEFWSPNHNLTPRYRGNFFFFFFFFNTLSGQKNHQQQMQTMRETGGLYPPSGKWAKK